MLKISTAIVLLVLAGSASAEWTSASSVDEFTDKQVGYAAFSDADHYIQLERTDTTVWMWVTRKKIGSFEPKGRIEMRVDRNDLVVINPEQREVLERMGARAFFVWEPQTVGFALLWHGLEKKGCGYVGELLQGKEMKIRYNVRYKTGSLGTETFSVSLVGARQAIIDGLALTECGQ